MTPTKKSYKTYKYTITDLDKALHDIHKGASIRKIAKEYGIPKSTLHSKATGRVEILCKKGPKPILSDEEENRLKQWILNKARLGFPMHPDEVKKAVQKILNDAS